MSDVVPGLDQPTRVLHAVPSPYPREARRAGIEGRVLVVMEIDERLYNVLQNRYGLASSGATDVISIPLK